MASFRASVAALHARGITGAGVAIGHLDTGVDGSHPALAGRIERFMWFSACGFVGEPAPATDRNGHGTQTAGLLVGGLLGGGPLANDRPANDLPANHLPANHRLEDRVSGVAPGARLHAGVVIEDGNIVARTLLGLDWLIDSGVSVVNLSFGIRGPNPVFRSLIRAMAQHDILVVAPIGNGGAGVSHSPGDYPEVLSVGAASEDGRVARFSGSVNDIGTRRCHRPDLVAPGEEVPSIAPGDGAASITGTSAASAIVAGMAALLRQAFPHAGAADIRRAMLASAAPLAYDQRMRSRHGLVRLVEAYEWLDDHRPWLEPEAARPVIGDAVDLPFIDPRLTGQLALRGDNEQADAIFEFGSHDEANAAAACFRSDMRERTGCVTCLRNVPLTIVRGRAGMLRQWVEQVRPMVANACDRDRSLVFP